jgi:hypothetical protein
VRTVAELVGQVMSLLIESRERVEEQVIDDKIHAIRDRVLERMNDSQNPVDALLGMSDSLMELMDADGLGYYHLGRMTVHGDGPSDADFNTIIGMLNTLEPAKIFVGGGVGRAGDPRVARAARLPGVLPRGASPGSDLGGQSRQADRRRDPAGHLAAQELRGVEGAGARSQPPVDPA